MKFELLNSDKSLAANQRRALKCKLARLKIKDYAKSVTITHVRKFTCSPFFPLVMLHVVYEICA